MHKSVCWQYVLGKYDGYDDYYWIVYHVLCCYKLIGQRDTVLETS